MREIINQNIKIITLNQNKKKKKNRAGRNGARRIMKKNLVIVY